MSLRFKRSALVFLTLACGCGSSEPSPAPATSGTAPSVAAPAQADAAPAPAPVAPAPQPAVQVAPPPRISLGGGGGSANRSTASTSSAPAANFTRDEVLAALKPMQILRDQWNALRQKGVASQGAAEEQVWIWDFRTNPRQPALVMSSPNGQYFRQARLTYDPSKQEFSLQVTDAEDRERNFIGDYSEPVQEIEMGDKKVHRVYKLQLTEIEPEKDAWRIVLNQQDNNRYLLELYRQRGGSFQRFDTVSAQREGTSFALSDTDYGERTCIISGGLGTMQVSYQGKSYWVCCTGCQAAFNDDPARWIAEYEAKKKSAD